MGRKSIDLVGQRFERIQVVERFSNVYDRHGVEWMCACDCGNKVIAYGHHLRQGKIKSCGCLKSETSSRSIAELNTKHGMYGSPEYMSWVAMKTRCSNPNHRHHDRYGGRGIKICDRWQNSFQNFLEDMGPRPSKHHTLDRWPDKDGDYKPDNCRWATWEEQASNRNGNVLFIYGTKKLTQSQLARELGVSIDVLKTRLKHSSTLNGTIVPV